MNSRRDTTGQIAQAILLAPIFLGVALLTFGLAIPCYLVAHWRQKQPPLPTTPWFQPNPGYWQQPVTKRPTTDWYQR